MLESYSMIIYNQFTIPLFISKFDLSIVSTVMYIKRTLDFLFKKTGHDSFLVVFEINEVDLTRLLKLGCELYNL